MGYVPPEAAPPPPLEAVEAPPETVELNEDQLRDQQTELRGQLVGLSKELMDASLKGDTIKVAALSGRIERINGQFDDLDAKMRLSKERRGMFKDLTKEEINLAVAPLGEFANLTEEEISNAVSALGSEEEPILLTPDMMKPIEVTDEMVVSVEPIVKPRSEVEESLAELQEIERQRVKDEKEGRWKPAEKPKSEVEQSLDELRQIEKERVAREAKEKPLRDIENQMRLLEAARKKAAPEEQRIIDQKLEALTRRQQEMLREKPTAAEIKEVLEKNELTPERKAVLEDEVRLMEQKLFEVENGIELIDRKTGKTENRPGLKELEGKFKQKFGLDLDEMAINKSVSRWDSFKIGLRSIFNREFRQTIRQYEERTEEYNRLKEDIELDRLHLENPKKYADIMDRRLMQLGMLNAKRRASASRAANPGIGTMKF
jgi:hypothetical protein